MSISRGRSGVQNLRIPAKGQLAVEIAEGRDTRVSGRATRLFIPGGGVGRDRNANCPSSVRSRVPLRCVQVEPANMSQIIMSAAEFGANHRSP